LTYKFSAFATAK